MIKKNEKDRRRDLEDDLDDFDFNKWYIDQENYNYMCLREQNINRKEQKLSPKISYR